MIKNIITPIQTWLLIQKRCVGCGTQLINAKNKKHKLKTIVTCKCRRIYILERNSTYRRARFNEL